MRFERIVRVAQTGSTNDDMAAILGEEKTRGLTIVADYQSSGSGRKGRSWIAPRGSSLLCTIALPDPLQSEKLWLVPFWIALCVRNALVSEGIAIVLQWPNDLLLGDAKCGGILCISRVTGDQAWAACGIGINLQRPSEAGELHDVELAPAFLSDVRHIERDELLTAILHEADRLYDRLNDSAFVVEEWQKGAGIPGTRYRLAVEAEREPIEGMAVGLSDGGGLVIQSNGARRVISMADARVLR